MTSEQGRLGAVFYFVWVASLLAVAGSLFFSEVMKFSPCVLCWYQRIFMFPLPLILGVGFFRDDLNSVAYALPLALLGALTAGYHGLLYYGAIPQALSPCTGGAGPSCTESHLSLLGFVSIPLLSLSAFLVILAGLVWIQLKRSSKP